MKKLLLLITTILFFLSCKLATQQNTSDFTFCLSDEVITNITRSYYSRGTYSDSNDELKIVVTLTGFVNKSQTIITSLNNLATKPLPITFRYIPLDKTFTVLIQVYIFNDELLFEGLSDSNKIKENTTLNITLQEQQNNEYVLYNEDPNYMYGFGLGLYKPYELKNATDESFLNYYDTEFECDSLIDFYDYEFDAQGNLWVISTGDGEDNKSLYRRINGLLQKVPTGEIPNYFCIDNKTNKLITCYQVIEGGNNITKFNTYTMNQNPINGESCFTNTQKTEGGNTFFEPDTNSTFTFSDVTNNAEGVDAENISLEAYNNTLYLAHNTFGDAFKSSKIFSYNIQSKAQQTSKEFPNYVINDILEQDGYLYGLLDANFRNHAYGPTTDTENNKFVINSNGTVFKYDLNNISNFNLIEPVKIAIPSSTTITANQSLCNTQDTTSNIFSNYFEGIVSNKISWNVNIEFNAPTYETQKAFFGPKRFIAIKPKKLVIADNGTFCYKDTDDEYYYKAINRIVTVDLESFAISSTQKVSINFTSRLSSGISGIEISSSEVASKYPGCLYLSSGTTVSSSEYFVRLTNKND